MCKLLYQSHSSRLKTLKCGDFYCRAFLSQESHSFIWLTQSRRIVDRHTDTHILSFSPFRSLSFARVLTLSFCTFITKHLNSMRCWADLIVPFSTSFARFRAFVCAVLWSSIFFDWETSNTLLIHLKHDPSIFWLISKSSIARPISFLFHQCALFAS